MLRRFLFMLFIGLLLTDIARAQITNIIQPVGVIEYNVNRYQGGWISGARLQFLNCRLSSLPPR